MIKPKASMAEATSKISDQLSLLQEQTRCV
jgi:hypothetical protein